VPDIGFAAPAYCLLLGPGMNSNLLQKAWWFPCLALTGALGCAEGLASQNDFGASSAVEPPPGTIVGKVDPGDISKAVTTYTYEYKFNKIAVPDIDPATYWCVPTHIQGGFNDASDEFHVWADSPYSVGGNSGYFDGYGKVTCVRHSAFVTDPGGVHWISSWLPVMGRVGYVQVDSRDMWWGSAASYVSEVGGEFAGGGEYIRINQSTSGTTPSKIELRTLASELHGAGYSYFAGVPQSGNLVRLYGYNTAGNLRRGDVNSAGTYEFDVGTTSGYSSYWLAQRSRAFCYFTRVSGKFTGGAEQVKIEENEDYWFLSATHGASQAVYASARCMAYDQRH